MAPVLTTVNGHKVTREVDAGLRASPRYIEAACSHGSAVRHRS